MTHPTPRQIDQWLFTSELLTPPETLFIRTHLEQCPICRTHVELLRIFNSHLQTHIAGIPSARDTEEAERIIRTSKINLPIRIHYKIAAVIACVALIGTGYYLGFQPNNLQPHTETVQDESLKETARQSDRTPSPAGQMIADNFSPSPHLEDLVQTEFRSAAVELLSPKIGETVHHPLRFTWNNAVSPLTLKIISNDGKTLLSKRVQSNSYMMKKKLSPGIYYWKLETEFELLFVGKFMVKE